MAPILALHAGAGLDPQRDYQRERAELHALVAEGRERLMRGEAAVDVAIQLVAKLETSGLYIAGRGASPNLSGGFELDAAVMNGVDGACGAVAALDGFQSAIGVADAVRTRLPHVLLAGAGAAAFAEEIGAARAPSPAWFMRAGAGEQIGAGADDHGTVGCVVRDAKGALAAAVATAGVLGKRQGRVGDTPLIGAGCWADKRIATVCTGLGEYFIRSAAAARVAHLVEFGGLSLNAACADALTHVANLGGAGGMIAVSASGAISMAHVGAGLKCAALRDDGAIVVHMSAAAGAQTPIEAR